MRKTLTWKRSAWAMGAVALAVGCGGLAALEAQDDDAPEAAPAVPVTDEGDPEGVGASAQGVTAPYPATGGLNGCTPIATVIASSEEAANPAGQALDGDLATRWSASGKGSWIQGDLGAERRVDHVQISWHRGDLRTSGFTVSLSLDGERFSEVYAGRSSGATVGLETYRFTGAPARYVRVTVNGSTESDWASITELTLTCAVEGTPAAPATGGLNGCMPIATVTASSEEEGNPAGQAVDGSLGTRWSAPGKGSWIQGNLEAERTVDHVQISWHRGDLRTSGFTVSLSRDGERFTEVYAGRSSGTTLGLETYRFTGAPARHVRVTVNGSTESDWASITELTLACPVTGTPTAEDPVVAAAGDVACATCKQSATANLLETLVSTRKVSHILALGDLAYEDGTLAQFNSYYAPAWGRAALKALTRPVPGNHEYRVASAGGYFDYFGAQAGPRGKGWYSYDVGSWHVIALNSNLSKVSQTEQMSWLKSDLAANAGQKCTLAYWHHPRWSDGSGHGDNSAMGPFISALYEAGAEVALAGHEHNFQQFAPMNPSGARDDAKGIRQFVVGSGGRGLSSGRRHAHAHLEYWNSSSHGVLELTLRPASYEWRFVSTSGAVLKSGTTACH